MVEHVETLNEARLKTLPNSTQLNGGYRNLSYSMLWKGKGRALW